MKKYYKTKDLQNGIWIEGVQVVPPFSSTLLRNLRAQRKITYYKQGRETVYTREDLEEYIESTKVTVKVA
jgi:hypothetical protein